MSTSRITYRVSDQHVTLLAKYMCEHERIVAEAGLAADITQLLIRTDSGYEYVEVIEWVDEHGEEDARKCEDIKAQWELMAACCETRGDLPPVSFDHVVDEELELEAILCGNQSTQL